MNIDALVENHFKKNRDIFGFEGIVQLIEEVMDEWGVKMPLLTERAEPSSETFTFDLIPTIPISELGWGQLRTPEEGGTPVDPKSRNQLAQYLKNIGGADISQKIVELNKFMNEEFTPSGGSPAEQLRQTISYLIFYKTLTSVITNFNASAAGFAFESFLAVLLDATGGKQIPASAGATIADIVLTSQDGLPISLKLYAEKSLKVGGSYRQLVDDLTGDYPLMQYIAVTKDIEGEGPTASGTLGFYAFNFTRENFLEVLAVKPKEMNLMSIPTVFFQPTAELEKAAQGGDLKSLLAIPGRTEVDLKPVLQAFMDAMRKQLPEELVEKFETTFAEVVDLETGIYKGTEDSDKPKRFAYIAMPKRRFAQVAQALGLPGKEEQKQVEAMMVKAHDAALTKRKQLGKRGSARKEKFAELKYVAARKSYKRLLQLQQEASPELFEMAMKSTIGYVKNIQFDLSRSDLGKLSGISNQDNLFPYNNELKVGSLEIGVQKVQEALDRSVNEFNNTIFTMFTDLKTLSTSLNGYVAGGLQDTAQADAAEKAATDIAAGTKEIK